MNRAPSSETRWLLLCAALSALLWLPASLWLATRPDPSPAIGLGLQAAKWLVWFAPAVWWARQIARQPLAATFRLRPTSPTSARAWAASVLVAALFLVAVQTLLAILLGGAPRVLPAAGAIVLTAINALGEEIAFRGFILGGLERRGWRWRANVITTMLFVLVHVPGWWAMGMGIGLVFSALLLSIFALVLGWIAQRTGSIWLSVLLHTVNNLMAR